MLSRNLPSKYHPTPFRRWRNDGTNALRARYRRRLDGLRRPGNGARSRADDIGNSGANRRDAHADIDPDGSIAHSSAHVDATTDGGPDRPAHGTPDPTTDRSRDPTTNGSPHEHGGRGQRHELCLQPIQPQRPRRHPSDLHQP
jgi:hypothetical protein